MSCQPFNIVFTDVACDNTLPLMAETAPWSVSAWTACIPDMTFSELQDAEASTELMTEVAPFKVSKKPRVPRTDLSLSKIPEADTAAALMDERAPWDETLKIEALPASDFSLSLRDITMSNDLVALLSETAPFDASVSLPFVEALAVTAPAAMVADESAPWEASVSLPIAEALKAAPEASIFEIEAPWDVTIPLVEASDASFANDFYIVDSKPVVQNVTPMSVPAIVLIAPEDENTQEKEGKRLIEEDKLRAEGPAFEAFVQRLTFERFEREALEEEESRGMIQLRRKLGNGKNKASSVPARRVDARTEWPEDFEPKTPAPGVVTVIPPHLRVPAPKVPARRVDARTEWPEDFENKEAEEVVRVPRASSTLPKIPARRVDMRTEWPEDVPAAKKPARRVDARTEWPEDFETKPEEVKAVAAAVAVPKLAKQPLRRSGLPVKAVVAKKEANPVAASTSYRPPPASRKERAETASKLRAPAATSKTQPTAAAPAKAQTVSIPMKNCSTAPRMLRGIR